MKTRWKLEPAQFTSAEVELITGVSAGCQSKWRSRGILPLKAGQGFLTLAEALHIFTLSGLSARGLCLRTFAGRIGPAIDYALVQLAAESSPWPFTGSHAELLRFKSWFAAQSQTPELVRRLLGLRQRGSSRFVAIMSHQGQTQSVAFNDLAEPLPRTISIWFDGKAVAQHFASLAGKPPFTMTVRPN